MLTILADHNVERHVHVLIGLCSSPDWNDIWESMACGVESFERLGIPYNMPDDDLWKLCQDREIILVTANRNADGPTALEVAIRTLCTARSLPVITISDADRLLRDREYAERAAAKLLGFLLDVENLRGTGRLYVP